MLYPPTIPSHDRHEDDFSILMAGMFITTVGGEDTAIIREGSDIGKGDSVEHVAVANGPIPEEPGEGSGNWGEEECAIKTGRFTGLEQDSG
ncbi:hypothetical protein SLA2020_202410 [Shorea laevis]